MEQAILPTIITGCFGILIALVQKSRKENIRDHGIVAERLEALREDIHDIDADIAVIEAKIDGHINDHAVGRVSEINYKKKSKA
jgi:hypothetical protein